MRYLLLLLISSLLVACASDLASEELGSDTAYAFSGQTSGDGATIAIESTPDTLPLPEAGENNKIGAGKEGQSPTPYGMEVPPEKKGQLTAKGTASANNSAPALAAQRLLTGRWINSEDEREHVAFTPTHYQTYYEGELLVEEDMTFHANCPTACSGGVEVGEPCFTIAGPAQTDCYGIVKLTDDLLELQMLGVSNETIVYRRED